jgi:hypothetical protein
MRRLKRSSGGVRKGVSSFFSKGSRSMEAGVGP